MSRVKSSLELPNVTTDSNVGTFFCSANSFNNVSFCSRDTGAWNIISVHVSIGRLWLSCVNQLSRCVRISSDSTNSKVAWMHFNSVSFTDCDLTVLVTFFDFILLPPF